MSDPRDEADRQNIENWFTYHAPQGNQQARYTVLRSAAKEFAKLIVDLVPQCADRTVALRKLREVVMVANAGIACEERGDATTR